MALFRRGSTKCDMPDNLTEREFDLFTLGTNSIDHFGSRPGICRKLELLSFQYDLIGCLYCLYLPADLQLDGRARAAYEQPKRTDQVCNMHRLHLVVFV